MSADLCKRLGRLIVDACMVVAVFLVVSLAEMVLTLSDSSAEITEEVAALHRFRWDRIAAIVIAITVAASFIFTRISS